MCPRTTYEINTRQICLISFVCLLGGDVFIQGKYSLLGKISVMLCHYSFWIFSKPNRSIGIGATHIEYTLKCPTATAMSIFSRLFSPIGTLQQTTRSKKTKVAGKIEADRFVLSYACGVK